MVRVSGLERGGREEKFHRVLNSRGSRRGEKFDRFDSRSHHVSSNFVRLILALP